MSREKHVITIDFETYYDTEYSLTKMPMQEYIEDERFEIIGVGYQLDDNEPVWLTDLYPLFEVHENGDQVPVGSFEEFRGLPWKDSICVAHNAMFDGYILERVLGIHPARYFCTMMGARPMLGMKLKSMSLASVSEYLGIGKKGDEVIKAKGKRSSDFTPEEMAAYGEYCRTDVRLSYIIYNILLSWFEENNVSLA